MATPRPLALVMVALFFSGTAGIVNQVVWQRALKLFVGGSDALSSMTVVLVFMAGLGAGAVAAGQRVRRIGDPLRLLAWVEVILALVNVAVATVLALDLSLSVFAAQRFALSLGVPLRLLYLVGAAALLLPPCFLMGVTLPVSSEGCQRQLGATESRLIPLLFAVNTLGAVLGAVAAAFFLLPWLGQRQSLGWAAGGNLAAAGLAFLASRRAGSAPALPEPPEPPAVPARLSVEERAGFWLGFLSLGYEMLLLRLVALAHEPRPHSFATILASFLLCWTVGVHASSRLPERLATTLALTAAGVAGSVPFQELDRFTLRLPLVSASLAYCLPVLGFGLAYGWLVSRSAREWGRDVGRFAAVNTLGSCLGVVFFVLVAYEIPPRLAAAALAIGVAFVLAGLLRASRADGPGRRAAGLARLAAAAAFVAVLAFGLGRDSWVTDRGFRAYYDPDGVVEIDGHGGMIWDGLWHSALARDGRHLGTPNWLLGAAPAIVHRGPVEEGLVVGLGTGVTAATVAQVGSLRTLDVYDLNPGLRAILRDYPEGTLHIASHPKVRFLWQDGRTGLSLSEKRYDLVTQQPQYLRQAGSSLLLSREYFALVRSRLKPGGVFCIYASAPESPSQAQAVRDTAASVFPHLVTFHGGYLVVASDTPLDASPEAFRARAALGDPLAGEMLLLEERMKRTNPEASVFDLLDSPALPSRPDGLVITDDRPISEYPEVTSRLLAREAGVARPR